MSSEIATPPIPDSRKPATWKRSLARAVLIYAVVPYVAIIAVMGFAQRWMIYQPTKTEPLRVKSTIDPAIEAEDVQIRTVDKLTLHGWRFHAQPTEDASQNFLVIYFPGNAGCRADRVTDCRDFTQLGCEVILFDYRGFGDNPGSPRESLLANDCSRIWNFATTELRFPPERIILFGESLGGAMATRLAAEQSQAGTPPAALILNSTFASLAETVAWHYPAFPFQYILLDRYPSVDRIPLVTCPVLQFHGTADDTVAFEQGRRLFAAAPAKSAQGIDKEFIAIPDGQHNFISMGDMRLAVQQLLRRMNPNEEPTSEK